MSIASIAPHFVFGISSNLKQNIFFLDEQHVLYPAGSNLILYNIEQKLQKFVTISESTSSVTCIALSQNKKYLAIAERGKPATVTIYDIVALRKRRSLSVADSHIKEYKHVAFSNDGKYVLATSNDNEWQACYWNWEKNRLITNSKLNIASETIISGISFYPNDMNHILVIGYGIFRVYKYIEGGFKLQPSHRHESKNYSAHIWIDNDVLLATNEGDFFLYSSGDFRSDIIVGSQEKDVNFPITCLVAYNRGFICGRSNGSILCFEKNEDRGIFRKSKDILTNDQQIGIKCVALSPSEDTLVVTLENSQIFGFMLHHTDVSKENSAPIFSQPFHHGAITGLDSCIRKPFIITCSADRSVRIWNYIDNSCEFVKYFGEELNSVAIHPSGFYILIGFNDKLRLMSVLVDEIRQIKEFPVRMCRECRFSNGGQYFAAVNGNTIHVYSTWTFNMISAMKGHIGKVKSLHWTENDQILISAGMDGAVYEWNVKNGTRINENVLKSCSYNMAVDDPSTKQIYAVGSDSVLRTIKDGQIVKELASDVQITQLVFSGKMLIAGTSSGTVRVIKYPIGDEKFEYQEHAFHSEMIGRAKFSFDNEYLFTAGDDGCLFVAKVADKDSKMATKYESQHVFTTEILITKNDVEEKIALVGELRSRVEELKMENEYQLRLKELTYKEKIHDLTEKMQAEIDTLKIHGGNLKTEKEQLELRHAEELSEIQEKCQKQIRDMETVNNEKLIAEYEKHSVLQARIEESQREWDSRLTAQRTDSRKAIDELTEAYEAKISRKEDEIAELRDEMHRQIKEFEQSIRDTEEDADSEIVGIQLGYEKRLKLEQEACSRIKGENSLLKKKFATLQKEIQDFKTELQKMVDNEKKLHGVIQQLEKDISNLKKEVQERDDTIIDKEKRIYDLKKKNQELEKFKFVLDHKIIEMKKQIEPREESIAHMSTQIKEMNAEIQRYYSDNSNLARQIQSLKMIAKTKDTEIRNVKEAYSKAHVLSERLRDELFRAVNHTNSPKEFHNAIIKMYHVFCANKSEDELAKETGKDISQEQDRQRIYLETTIANLKNHLVSQEEMRRDTVVRLMMDNTMLLKELNIVTKDNHSRKLKEFRRQHQSKAVEGAVELPKL